MLAVSVSESRTRNLGVLGTFFERRRRRRQAPGKHWASIWRGRHVRGELVDLSDAGTFSPHPPITNDRRAHFPHAARPAFHSSDIPPLPHTLDISALQGTAPTTMATVQDVTSEAAFQSQISSLPPSTLAVIYFHAPWAAPCKQMSVILSTLASTYPANAPISFVALDAEELPEIAEQYDVSAVPFVVLQRGGKVLETVSGSDAAKVRAAVEKYAGAGSGDAKASLPPAQTVNKPAQTNGTDATGAKNLAAYAPSASDPNTAPEYSSGDAEASKEELNTRLGELVKAAPVMLFMKGTPSSPQCGFSRQTVALLREKGIRYGFFNILADDEVRQGLKEYSDWPTFPQVYADGELVGGLDIVRFETHG
jgi:Grx4 family monothiol glutaredoxin